MLGLFAFFYAAVHVTIYLVLDQGLEFQFMLADVAKRPFITAGMSRSLLMVPLALTSTSGWIRRLGQRWPRLHRLVYICAIAASLHFIWKVKVFIGRRSTTPPPSPCSSHSGSSGPSERIQSSGANPCRHKTLGCFTVRLVPLKSPDASSPRLLPVCLISEGRRCQIRYRGPHAQADEVRREGPDRRGAGCVGSFRCAEQREAERLLHSEVVRSPLQKSWQKVKPPLGWPRETDSLCPVCVREARQDL